ncbi:MAG: nucleotide exchange factor GrpE [Pseudomonadales bacterium]|nr:nucleotide exchange factor GrpE [Pseudomonadales bacterium]
MANSEEQSRQGEEPVAEELDLEPQADELAEAADDAAAELEQARAEIEKYKDLALRAEAEMANVRRRAERDVENAHKFGVERFLQNLVPVVDSLEKAIESAEQAASGDPDQASANQAIIEGVGLCLKMLLDVMAKEGVEVHDPHGEPFDPNLHQAMSMVESPHAEPNSVVQVIQKGYSLNSRLVRPALVMVSKQSS